MAESPLDELAFTLEGHEDKVNAVAFSPDGTQLFTVNANTTCYQLDFAKLLDD